MPDPLLASYWLPVAAAHDLADRPVATTLLGEPLVLWRDATGAARAFADRCPHRGARLSMGRVVDGRLACPYHGWRFDGSAQCTHWPAHPAEAPPAVARAQAFATVERYGLVWTCLSEPRADVPAFPAHDAPGKRAFIDGPYDFAACAPRVVENFLDMAHFPFVHADVLGAEPYTEVADYDVSVTSDGVQTAGCRFWQPQPSGLAQGGAFADYQYTVTHPTVARLAKLPGRPDAFEILLATAPLDETRTRVWKVNVFADCSDEQAARFGRFSRAAMLQDQPIVESQRPQRLPLDPRAEIHQRADRVSAAYRRWLRELGMAYGVTR